MEVVQQPAVHLIDHEGFLYGWDVEGINEV